MNELRASVLHHQNEGQAIVTSMYVICIYL